MGLKITNKADTPENKCIHQNVADIPGGVTVSVKNLGGLSLKEGTPIGKGVDGMYDVVKTAQIVSDVAADATTIAIAKGSHFKANDYFAADGVKGQKIASVDKSDSAQDVITLSTTLGKAITAATIGYHSNGNATTLKVIPVGVTGTSCTVDGGNLFVPCIVMGILNAGSAPKVTDNVKTALKGIHYV